MSASDEQVFEFKGNAIIHFRVVVTPAALSVSTHEKRGGEAVRTWIVRHDNVSDISVSERIGAGTRSAALYVKPRSGDLTMFSWTKNALGSPESQGKVFYAAAAAALRTIAAHRPEFSVPYGPMLRAPYLVGALFAVIVGVLLVMPSDGSITLQSAMPGALVLVLATLSIARSGVFSKRRVLPINEAAELLAARAAEL
jgi:hypothetical protein